MMAEALKGKWYGLPEVDPWQAKQLHPEAVALKPKRVIALPPPPEPAEIVRDIIHVASGPADPTLHQIASAVCRVLQVSPRDFHSPRRFRHVTRARQIYFWIARNRTSRSLPEIGRRCGGKDHSTVMHGIHKIDGDFAAFSADIDAVIKALWEESR
jgi:hypothetical protein